MTAEDSNAESYALRSELAQFCLPAAQRDRHQRLAWINAICLLYLGIGLAGIKPPLPVVRAVQPIEEPVVVPIEAPPPQVVQTDTPPEQTEPSNNEPTEAPAIVAVTLETPSVVFSVPTVGNVLVSSGVAQAPPPRPLDTTQTFTNKIFNIKLTGRSGDYPAPDYPQWALQGGMKGLVQLLITVDPSGAVTGVEVEKSCGSPRLDQHTIAHVKRRFTFGTAEATRVFRLPMEYSPQ